MSDDIIIIYFCWDTRTYCYLSSWNYTWPKFWDKPIILRAQPTIASAHLCKIYIIQQCYSFRNNGNDVRRSRCYSCWKLIVLVDFCTPYVHVHMRIMWMYKGVYMYNIHYTDIHILLLLVVGVIVQAQWMLLLTPSHSLKKGGHHPLVSIIIHPYSHVSIYIPTYMCILYNIYELCVHVIYAALYVRTTFNHIKSYQRVWTFFTSTK